MSLLSLADFSFNSDNGIPVCEINGQLQICYSDTADVNYYTTAVEMYPKLHLGNKSRSPWNNYKLTNYDLLQEVDSDLIQSIKDAWFESGFYKVLEILSNQQYNNITNNLANFLLYLKVKLDFIREVHWFPFDSSVDESINLLNVGPVKCIAWHQKCVKLAIATDDDIINVYAMNSRLIPVLLSKDQQKITCCSWRPNTGCELAVGCEAGVYIWTIDPNSVITKPSINCATLLKEKNHKLISSIAWHPEGDLLASVSSIDKTMYIWSPDTNINVPLKRIGGGNGFTLIKWSANGDKLLAATNNSLFRLWYCSNWESESWLSGISGCVSAAVFCYDNLLFTNSNSSCIYCLRHSSSIFTQSERSEAYVIFDLTPIELPNGQMVGGYVCNLCWDGKDILAVSFYNSGYIAIFQILFLPAFKLIPKYFLHGSPQEIPSKIEFQPNFPGSNLSIAWNSGRFQYFPLIRTKTF